MEQIFSSLIPIFSLIVMGYLFKKISFPSNDFWPMADKLTYYILMPALLIFTLSKAKLDSNSVDLVLVSIFEIFLTMFFLIIFFLLIITAFLMYSIYSDYKKGRY